MLKKNIILIGMPACGKSTAGVVLAKTIGLKFIDTDLLIQQRENRLLQEIINEEGMDGFISIEEQVLSDLDVEEAVISTGGSVVYSDSAMENLRNLGVIVYIKLPLNEIRRRLNNIKTRGIAMSEGETLETLYDRRVGLYEKYSNITIDAQGKSLEELVEEIAEKTKAQLNINEI